MTIKFYKKNLNLKIIYFLNIFVNLYYNDE